MAYNRDRVAAITKDWQARSGMEPKEIAFKMGVHRSVAYDVVRGDPVSESTLRLYASVTGATPEELSELLIAAGKSRPSDPAVALTECIREFFPDIDDSEAERFEAAMREVMKAFVPD